MCSMLLLTENCSVKALPVPETLREELLPAPLATPLEVDDAFCCCCSCCCCFFFSLAISRFSLAVGFLLLVGPSECGRLVAVGGGSAFGLGFGGKSDIRDRRDAPVPAPLVDLTLWSPNPSSLSLLPSAGVGGTTVDEEDVSCLVFVGSEASGTAHRLAADPLLAAPPLRALLKRSSIASMSFAALLACCSLVKAGSRLVASRDVDVPCDCDGSGMPTANPRAFPSSLSAEASSSDLSISTSLSVSSRGRDKRLDGGILCCVGEIGPPKVLGLVGVRPNPRPLGSALMREAEESGVTGARLLRSARPAPRLVLLGVLVRLWACLRGVSGSG